MITPTEQYNKELYHYGVVGMKWGIRRAKKRGETYNYRSFEQKSLEKRLSRQKNRGASKEKISKTKRELDIYKTRDKARQRYAEKTSVGEAVARGVLLGPVGATVYNSLRSSGQSKGASVAAAMLSNFIPIGLSVGLSNVAEYESASKKTRRK